MGGYSFNSVFHRVDLSLLRHFFAIATFGGFSRASRATGVSQPALSLGLKKLEKSLGVTLINRSARPFELTQAGFTLLDFCQRLEGNFDSVMSSLGAPEPTARKRLRIGTALSIGFAPMLELCERIAAGGETFELEMVGQNTYQLLADVREGRLDAAFVPNDVFDSRLRFVTLHRDPIIFVVGERHRGTFGRGALRKAAARIPLVASPRETPMRTLTDRICAAGQLEFKTVYSVNSMEALKLLVERSQGGAFVLKSLVAAELKARRLFEEKLPVRLPSSGVALALPREATPGAVSRQLASLLKNKTP